MILTVAVFFHQDQASKFFYTEIGYLIALLRIFNPGKDSGLYYPIDTLVK